MSKAKVLVIDDDPEMLDLARFHLEKDGYEVTCAETGAQGLRLVAEHRHEVALTDLKLPDIYGIDLVVKLKESSPATEVIMITGYGAVSEAIEATKAGGELALESIDGDIRLTDIVATALEASSVDGDVTFSGSFASSGRYRFTTHAGDVLLVLPENTSATFVVRRSDAREKLDSTLPLKPAAEGQRGRRMTYTLGGGSAQVEVEAFDGDIRIRKPGDIKK